MGVDGSAQKAMGPIKPGGWFVTIAGDVAPKPKLGVHQEFIEHWPKNASTLDEIAAMVDRGELVAKVRLESPPKRNILFALVMLFKKCDFWCNHQAQLCFLGGFCVKRHVNERCISD